MTGCANCEGRRPATTGRVLVAYGTTNGSTAQIAEAVAQVLCNEGLTAGLLPAPEASRCTTQWWSGAHCTPAAGEDARRFAAATAGPSPNAHCGSSAAGRWTLQPRSGTYRPLGVREHVTFGGCLEEGASGRAARMILPTSLEARVPAGAASHDQECGALGMVDQGIDGVEQYGVLKHRHLWVRHPPRPQRVGQQPHFVVPLVQAMMTRLTTIASLAHG